jgi:hypothetical protein
MITPTTVHIAIITPRTVIKYSVVAPIVVGYVTTL